MFFVILKVSFVAPIQAKMNNIEKPAHIMANDRNPRWKVPVPSIAKKPITPPMALTMVDNSTL